MARLTLSLLGPLHVTLDNRTVSSFGYDKVRALLAYLVLESDRPHRREALAELLWPEQPAAAARHSLSQALATLRQAIGDHGATPPFLLVSRESVQWNPAGDYAADIGGLLAPLDACLRHAHPRRDTCAQCAQRIGQIVELYGGPLLAQLTIPDSSAFEEWVVLRREWLQQRQQIALGWLSEYHAARGAYDQATTYAERQLALDPWREESHRQLMRLLALGGQRAAALRHYQRCRALLADELGIEPDTATTALFEQIRSGRLAPVAAADVGSARATQSAHNLPVPATPLVGRARDIDALAGMLADPACRLITLVGPGGVGKTRLGQHVAQAALDAFADGVCWVALASVSAVPGMLAAIADALHLQLFGQDDPQAQLRAYLQPRQLLLLLDNFEHLLESAALIADLLAAAPELRMIVTSRERLGLRGEWVYQVEGLSVPLPAQTEGLASYGAVQLWLQSARRLQRQTALSPDDLAAVAQICRLTGGLPLALELAAAWSAVLPCREIAGEIARSLDFLAATTRDLPERHRSMRAVFDHSWSLLGERERRVFARLSVFQGSLSRDAAERVADAGLPGLSALVAKSLLRRGTGGRYEMHELLRQYGAERLADSADEERLTRARHAAYYAGVLVECAAQLKGPGQPAAIQAIIADIENIRAAWGWAVTHADLDLLDAAFEGLWLFFASHGNVGEAGALFEQAIAALEALGQLPAAQRSLRDRLLARLDSGLAAMRYRLGQVDRARRLLDRAVERLRRLDAPRDMAFAQHHLAATLHLAGAYREEQAALSDSIALSEAVGDRWLSAYSLNDLGLCWYLLGDQAAARRCCSDSLAIFEALGDRRGMAFALNNLGVVAAVGGEPEQAERLYRDSLELRRAIDDRWGIAVSSLGLGRALRAAGQPDQSRATLLDALAAAYRIRALPVALELLVELAGLMIDGGDERGAQQIVGAVLAHPAAPPAAQERARELAPSLPRATPGRVIAVDALIDALLAADRALLAAP